MASNLNECENCGKRTREELYTRHGFLQTYYVEFVCAACFKKLEDCTFDQYGAKEETGDEKSA